MDRQEKLLSMYEALYRRLGPSHWWPGETPLEICLGAILTQNTNWSNVQKAMERLKAAKLLEGMNILNVEVTELADIIRPAGYFRVKAQRIRHFLAFFEEKAALQFEKLARLPLDDLRSSLLQVKGIGPETADSMLLYALGKPSFVVDAYTARICSRHQLTPEDISYAALRDFFMEVLPEDVHFFNEYHALLVRTGKKWCLKKGGDCDNCPLAPFL